jgi:hypothetical protein
VAHDQRVLSSRTKSITAGFSEVFATNQRNRSSPSQAPRRLCFWVSSFHFTHSQRPLPPHCKCSGHGPSSPTPLGLFVFANIPTGLDQRQEVCMVFALFASPTAQPLTRKKQANLASKVTGLLLATTQTDHCSRSNAKAAQFPNATSAAR